jgi:hypothetical protein
MSGPAKPECDQGPVRRGWSLDCPYAPRPLRAEHRGWIEVDGRRHDLLAQRLGASAALLRGGGPLRTGLSGKLHVEGWTTRPLLFTVLGAEVGGVRVSIAAMPLQREEPARSADLRGAFGAEASPPHGTCRPVVEGDGAAALGHSFPSLIAAPLQDVALGPTQARWAGLGRPVAPPPPVPGSHLP